MTKPAFITNDVSDQPNSGDVYTNAARESLRAAWSETRTLERHETLATALVQALIGISQRIAEQGDAITKRLDNIAAAVDHSSSGR